MRYGLDSSYGGTVAQYNQAAANGITWWGHYYGGGGAYRIWPQSERDQLFSSRIAYHLPIWVPLQSFRSDPVTEAWQAIVLAAAYGWKLFALDVEHGSGYTLQWGEAFWAEVHRRGFDLVIYRTANHAVPLGAADWLASWTGSVSSVLGERQAQQYTGARSLFGLSVDCDAASDSFPLVPIHNISPTIPQLVKGSPVEVSFDSSGHPVAVVGNDPANGHLMVFDNLTDGNLTVTDVTDKIHNINPSDSRTYKVV